MKEFKQKLIQDLYDLNVHADITIEELADDIISDTAVLHGYYKGANYANYRIKQVKENCEEYYSLLSLAQDKKVLSQSDYDDVLRCVEELRLNSATSYFFDEPLSDDIEKVFQLKFKAEFEGIGVRCMFDELIVDHTNKVIYPIDLKTTGHPEEEFEGSFVQWRYEISNLFVNLEIREILLIFALNFKSMYYEKV